MSTASLFTTVQEPLSIWIRHLVRTKWCTCRILANSPQNETWAMSCNTSCNCQKSCSNNRQESITWRSSMRSDFHKNGPFNWLTKLCHWPKREPKTSMMHRQLPAIKVVIKPIINCKPWDRLSQLAVRRTMVKQRKISTKNSSCKQCKTSRKK